MVTETGDVRSEGTLWVSGDAAFKQNVTLGRNGSDVIEFFGTVVHKSGNLLVDTDALLKSDVWIQRTTSVGGDAMLGADLSVKQDTAIGGPVVMQGDLNLRDGAKVLMYVEAASGDVLTDGSMRVKGALARFGGDVHIDSTAGIQGEMTVHAHVDVLSWASFGGNMAIGGNLDAAAGLAVGGSLKITQDGFCGDAADDTTVSLKGSSMRLLDQTQTIQFSAMPTGDTYAKGGMSFAGSVTLAGSVNLGESGGQVTVHAESLLRGSMTMNDALMLQKLDVLSPKVSVQRDLEAKGDTVITTAIGELAVEVSSNLNLINPIGSGSGSGLDLFSVDSKTGDVLMSGDVEVSGDITLEGLLESPALNVNDIKLDRLSAVTGEDGVAIEGVVFKDGMIEWNKVHTIHSLNNDEAVSIDGVLCKDGQMQLQASDQTTDSTDILTLINTDSSVGADASLTFKQTYHSELTPVPTSTASSSLAIQMSNAWTEDPATHNSHIAFASSSSGAMDERMRITSDGDLLMNDAQNRIVFRANGKVEVKQDMVIGAGQYGAVGLTVQSQADAARLRIAAGGGAGASISLSSPYGDAVSSFAIVNEAGPPMIDVDGDGNSDLAPKLKIVSGGSSMLDLTDLGGHGSLHLSGNYELGSATSALKHTFLVQSGAASELYIQSASDAAVTIQSGKDRQAQLVLIDPALNGNGNTFTIVNDGGNNVQKNLKVVDGDGNTMVSIADMGATGDLVVTGDGVIGSKHVAGDRTLTVQSSNVAEIDVIAGSESDAVLKITSGQDRESSLVLIDPASGDEGSEFHIVNAGAEHSYPTMRFTDGEYDMMSLIDKGTTGDLHVTGSGLVGSPAATNDIVLTVESATEAFVEVKVETAATASTQLISGGDQNSKIVLADSADPQKTFEIFNEGSSAESALTFCTMSPCEAKLMQVVRREQVLSEGSTGDLVVNGNALLGGPTAVGTRTLRVVSSLAAEIKVLSGPTAEAQVMVQSGPNMDSKLVLVDPSAGAAGSVFELVNRGTEVTPTLQITDGTNNLLTITDQGTTGDLVITGSGLFGGSSVMEDRTLSVRSGMQAQLNVVSVGTEEATVTVTAGVDKKARMVLSGALVGANNNQFEILNDGTQNLEPKLRIGDGTYDFLVITDAGDTTGDMLVTGSMRFGPDSIVHSCVEAAAVSVPADATACAAVTGLDLMSAAVCELVMTDDLLDAPNTQACTYVPSVTGPRVLSVLSSAQASVDVLSGDAEDAIVKLLAGVDKDAKLILEDATSGSRFTVLNDASETDPTLRIINGVDTMLTLSDNGGTAPGDLSVTGSATFGKRDPCRQLGMFETCGAYCVIRATCAERAFLVQASAAASVSILSTVGDASLTLTAGSDRNAKIVLEDSTITAAGASGSLFSVYNDGIHDTRKQLIFSDDTDALMNLVDLSDTALLEVTGNGNFGTLNGSIAQRIRVQSAGQASAKMTSGSGAAAHLTITSGANKDAILAFTADPSDVLSGSARSSIFEMKLSGASALADPSYSALDFTDGGTEPIMRITDVGTTADLSFDGTISCENLVSGSNATLGNDLSDQINILGHLTTDLTIDADHDGNRLTLAMTDPTENNQISFPDETGTILTTASVLSRLTTVGDLEAGSIAPGFGTIVTGSNIETTGTITAAGCDGVADDPIATPDCAAAFGVKAPDTSRSACEAAPGCTYTPGVTTAITASGTVTAKALYQANGDIYLGDTADDILLINGVMTSDWTMGHETSELFGPDIDIGNGEFTQLVRDKSRRLTFKWDDAGSKTTSISARFTPTTIDSPAGERIISIPDVPSGGAAHITIAAFGQVHTGASCTTPNCLLVTVQGRTPTSGILINANEVLMDVTAGYIQGLSGLAAGAEEQIGLINRLILKDTILIANIGDFGGTTGMPHVQAVAVDTVNGGRATIVVRNIATDPAEVVSVPYKVAWSIFR